MNNKKLYNRKEMEERLPDYIFDELSIEEKEIFDNSLPDYPDIAEEITQVRKTFALLDKIDYDKVLFDKTKDIPSRVVRALNQPKPSRKGQTLRFLVPALVVSALLFVAINTGLIDKSILLPQFQKKGSEKLAKIDQSIDEIFASSDIDSEIDYQYIDARDYADMNFEDYYSEIDQYFHEYVYDVEQYFSTFNLPTVDMLFLITNNLNNIDEDSFEKIIEEVKNAKLKS